MSPTTAQPATMWLSWLSPFSVFFPALTQAVNRIKQAMNVVSGVPGFDITWPLEYCSVLIRPAVYCVLHSWANLASLSPVLCLCALVVLCVCLLGVAVMTVVM